jgi:hypothetical protein
MSETPKQRFRRCAAKIADSVTYVINVQKMEIDDALGAIFKKSRSLCCPLGAVDSMVTRRGGYYYPTAPEAAELLGCKEAEACAFIIGFEGVLDLDGMSRESVNFGFPKWVALGEAYRERFVAAA